MGIDEVRARMMAIQTRFTPPPRAVAGGGPAPLAGGDARSFADVLATQSQRVQGPAGTPGATGAIATGTSSAGLPGAATMSPQLRRFVDAALAQSGDEYVWGSETTADEANPDQFDCSELVQWAGWQAGVEIPDGSWYQYLHLKQRGAEIPVEEALRTPGALLFNFSSPPTPGGPRPTVAHVAISLGDGRTIEARGREWGVGTWNADDRFTLAAVIPGLHNR